MKTVSKITFVFGLALVVMLGIAALSYNAKPTYAARASVDKPALR